MHMHMLGSGMKSGPTIFFLFDIFFTQKKECKRCERNTETSNPNKFELLKP